MKFKYNDCPVLKYLFMFVFSLLAMNVILFTYFNALPFVTADGWRFINIYLIPWHKGVLGISDLFQDHHPSPLIAILFILNSELFASWVTQNS